MVGIRVSASAIRERNDWNVVRDITVAFLVCDESCLKVVSRHLRRKHHSGFGAQRRLKLSDELVGFGRREGDGGRLAGVLNYGSALQTAGLHGRLPVLVQNVENDLLVLADKLDRMP